MVPAKDPEPMDTMRRSLTPAASGNSRSLWSRCVMVAATTPPPTPPYAGAINRAPVQRPDGTGGGADVAEVEVQVVAVDDVGAGEEEGRRRGEVVAGRHGVPEQGIPEHPPQRGPIPSLELERRPPAPRASSGASAALLPPILPPYAHLFLFDVWAPPPPPTLSQCDSRLVTRPAPSSSVAACVAQRQAAPLPRQQVMHGCRFSHLQAAKACASCNNFTTQSMCFGVSVSILHIGATYSIWQV
ncbi:hypothetical protein SETIT_1G125600v2 [Setaria italica]|uniref:Uncharacterized protein n=1 Tax=Setaria italica TaxID=4555 RepID=A0A368PJJ9_SETIT|nr:hypothetical protein SETIT_1G125600v2 [Setaria italica]